MHKQITVRVLFGVLAGALFIGAILALQQESHYACDEYARSSEGTSGGECVGDYLQVEGGDGGKAFYYVMGGVIFIIAAIKYKEENEDDNDDTYNLRK